MSEPSGPVLTVVDDEPFDAQGNFVANKQVDTPRAPYEFEGTTIEDTQMSLKSAAGLEIDGRRLKIDDIVEMKVIGRVVAVGHPLNDKTGKVVRSHLVKLVEVEYQRAFSPAGGVEFL